MKAWVFRSGDWVPARAYCDYCDGGHPFGTGLAVQIEEEPVPWRSPSWAPRYRRRYYCCQCVAEWAAKDPEFAALVLTAELEA